MYFAILLLCQTICHKKARVRPCSASSMVYNKSVSIYYSMPGIHIYIGTETIILLVVLALDKYKNKYFYLKFSI